MTLICFASQKGSPGTTATSLAVAAALKVADGRRKLLLEADSTGGTLAIRYRLPVEPGLLTLAAAIRGGIEPDGLWRHAQQLPGGLPVVVCPDGPEQVNAAMAASGGQMGRFLSGLRDVDVICDVGRLAPDSPVLDFVAEASAVLMVARPTAEQLQPAARRMMMLRNNVANLGWVLIGQKPYGPADVESTYKFPVVGVIADDARSVTSLENGVVTKRIRRHPFIRSSATLAQTLSEWLAPLATPAGEPAQPAPEQSTVSQTQPATTEPAPTDGTPPMPPAPASPLSAGQPEPPAVEPEVERAEAELEPVGADAVPADVEPVGADVAPADFGPADVEFVGADVAPADAMLARPDAAPADADPGAFPPPAIEADPVEVEPVGGDVEPAEIEPVEVEPVDTEWPPPPAPAAVGRPSLAKPPEAFRTAVRNRKLGQDHPSDARPHGEPPRPTSSPPSEVSPSWLPPEPPSAPPAGANGLAAAAPENTGASAEAENTEASAEAENTGASAEAENPADHQLSDGLSVDDLEGWDGDQFVVTTDLSEIFKHPEHGTSTRPESFAAPAASAQTAMVAAPDSIDRAAESPRPVPPMPPTSTQIPSGPVEAPSSPPSPFPHEDADGDWMTR